jgi:hypothetical protein
MIGSIPPLPVTLEWCAEKIINILCAFRKSVESEK